MGEVLSFREEHAEEVARIYLRAGRGQDRAPGKSLTQYVAQLHLANPWATPEIPSWVYAEKGKIVGALGVMPRAMEFQGQPLRVATMTLYLVDPDYRNGPAGIHLLRRALKGPQDLSWTDGASGSVYALWSAMGGHTAPLYAFNWMRVLRPLGMARAEISRAGPDRGALKHLSLLTTPVDWALSKMPVAALRPPSSRYSATLVSAEELLAAIGEIGWREALKPIYSAESFHWLMEEAAKSQWGKLRMMTVANEKGELRGWFVYYATPGGSSLVLQIGVRGNEDFQDTMMALLEDAWNLGSVGMKGASIPQYLTAMTEAQCIFRQPYNRVVVHSRNPAIVEALRTGEAAISRLDGIGWLRFSQEAWDR